ncbi:MAG: glycosyltransferase family 61 protein [Proteobacteria bacterium]|nr:glycosyltransferase family 61 protein [Pseudomonadota bacterium]
MRQLRHAAVLGGSSNYYHWLIDHLPRMALIEPGEDRILIVNRPISAVQREALGELGFPPDRLLPIEPDECVEVDDLLLPSLMSRSSLLHPEALAWLRRKFLPVAPTATAARIYVSRSKALKRRLLDEDAVIGMLRRHGFAVIHAEDLSFRRQVATFSSAQVIVAPHGAALSNLAFASSGSQVIEIDAEGSRRSFFAILAKMTGAHHQRVSADPIAPSALQDTDLVLGEHGLARLQTALASVCPD